jgi:hypothetical protein
MGERAESSYRPRGVAWAKRLSEKEREREREREREDTKTRQPQWLDYIGKEVGGGGRGSPAPGL